MARMMELAGAREAIAFDDVLLTAGYSTVLLRVAIHRHIELVMQQSAGKTALTLFVMRQQLCNFGQLFFATVLKENEVFIIQIGNFH